MPNDKVLTKNPNSQSKPLEGKVKRSTPTFDEFLKVGCDLKGQTQSYQVLRYIDTSITIGFNFGALILPGLLTLAVNVNGKLRRGKAATRMVHVLPAAWSDSNKDVHNEKPLVFASLYGLIQGLGGKIDLEASIGVTVGIADAEVATALLEVKAGAAAQFGGETHGMFAVDYYPRYYSKEQMSSGLAELRADYAKRNEQSKEDKEAQKRAACAIVHKDYTSWGCTISTDELIPDLEKIVRGGVEADVKRAHAALIGLQPYRVNFPLQRSAFLRLVGGEMCGSATVGSKVNVKVPLPPCVAPLINATANLVECAARRARTSFRLQLPTEPPSGAITSLVFTQDTVVDYIQTAEVKLFTVTVNPPKNTTPVYNTIRYASTALYWLEPTTSAQTKERIKAQPGSGLCLGIAMPLETLVGFFEVGKTTVNPAAAERWGALARGLGVTDEQMTRFLESSCELLRDLKREENGNPSAVLVETSFRPNEDRSWTFVPFVKNGLHGEPESDMHKTLLADFRQAPGGFELESIRLRYRIADTKKSESKFSLGVKFVVSVGITLNNVETVGSEGIVDINTVWFGARAADEVTYGDDPGSVYERAIPPVALLHQ